MEQYEFREQPSILIQGAMDTETQYLIGELEEAGSIRIGNWEFYTGFLGRKREPVVISKTFQGMVNAAAATSLALAHFRVKAVINQGIGGGHDMRFHRGDIVIGEKVIPMGAVVRRFAPMGAGIDETDFELLKIEIYNKRIACTQKVSEFPCDEGMRKAAGRVRTEFHAAEGIIGSADEWNNQIDRIALLRDRYQTAVEDMESAAPAQLCLSYGIPFQGIRILSNSIVNNEEFDESVGLDCQRFIVKYVEELHDIKLSFPAAI